MKNAFKKAAVIAAFAALSLDAAAQAFIELENSPGVIGLGIGTVPDYRGSDDSTGAVAPFFRYTLPGTERYLQLNATELSFNVLNSQSFRFGPVLNYHFGRDDDIDDEVVKRMAEIDGTVEAGIFGEIAWIERGNPRNRFILGATLLADVGGESEGYRLRLNARYWRQVSPAIDLHIGGGLWYASSDYNNHYFGVNTGNRGTSGLPLYEAGSGTNEYFLTLGAVAYFSRSWAGMAGIRLSQITGDAKDSPVVSIRGDKSQFIGGVGVAYMWR
jgi:outer membrane protein